MSKDKKFAVNYVLKKTDQTLNVAGKKSKPFETIEAASGDIRDEIKLKLDNKLKGGK